MKPPYTFALIIFAIVLLAVLMVISLSVSNDITQMECGHIDIQYVPTSIVKLQAQKELYFDKMCTTCGKRVGYKNEIAYYEMQLETIQTRLDSLYY